jgi:hypothetical protein
LEILFYFFSGKTDPLIVRIIGSATLDVTVIVFVKSPTDYNPSTVDSTLKTLYDVQVHDFNRAEGDRIVAVGYGDSVDAVKIDENVVNNTQAVHFSDSLTVYFDLSFAREFDSNFALRMADFDKH